jgi:hypothetical protein
MAGLSGVTLVVMEATGVYWNRLVCWKAISS